MASPDFRKPLREVISRLVKGSKDLRFFGLVFVLSVHLTKLSSDEFAALETDCTYTLEKSSAAFRGTGKSALLGAIWRVKHKSLMLR